MEVAHRERMLIVGLEVQAAWQALWTEVPEAWDRFRDRVDEIQHQTGSVFVEVSVEIADDTYTEVLGVEVDRADDVPDGLAVLDVPAANYVHHRHIGPTEAIADTFRLMYDWADEQGIPVADFKLDFGYTAAGDGAEHHLYVRVAD